MKGEDELNSQHLSKLEKFASELLEVRYSSADEFWKYEQDLAAYQVELQKSIEQEKEAKRQLLGQIKKVAGQRHGDWREKTKQLQEDLKQQENRISTLSDIHALSRQIGDAFAWLFLGLEQKYILPLTYNQRVPAVTSGLSLKGMLIIAEQMANKGMGFPLLHDISNCLRVGDITFVKPGERPVTVEVKTHIVSQEGNMAHLSVEVWTPGDEQRVETVFANLGIPELKRSDTANAQPAHPRRQLEARLRRQLERMGEARMSQMAESGAVLTGKETDKIVLEIDLSGRHSHSREMSEVVLSARAEGYASRLVDETLLYAAAYTPEPLVATYDKEHPPEFFDKLLQDLTRKIQWYEDTSRNYMWYTMSWTYNEGEAPPQVRPFLLHDFPLEIKMDILWGRLSFYVFANLGRMAEIISRAGYRALPPADHDAYMKYFMPIWSDVPGPNGEKAELFFGGLHHVFARVGFEFMSMEGVLSMLGQMKTSIALVSHERFQKERAEALRKKLLTTE